MKLVIIGAGSSYTPGLIQGLIEHYEALPFSNVCLMDIDKRRLEILTGLSQRMLSQAGLPIAVTLGWMPGSATSGSPSSTASLDRRRPGQAA
jgi:6-phospho-beta-glucosidase